MVWCEARIRRSSVCTAIAFSVALAAGCGGGSGEAANGDDANDNDNDNDNESDDENDSDSHADPSDDVGPTGDDAPTGSASHIAPSGRLARLTHAQWEKSCRDLFELGEVTGLSSLFRADPKVAGFVFDNNASTLDVDQALWRGYQTAAAEMAERATSDEAMMHALVPPSGEDESARARAFVDRFGRRAYRRPLHDAERTALLGQFEDGALHYDGIDGFTAGVRLVVETVLQSPYFLYRVERSDEIVDAAIPLDGWEVAHKLSYALWGTMPDEALFDAAQQGELADVSAVRSEAGRLLDDPRARETILSFHGQLLNVGDFEGAHPSASLFPHVSDRLGEFALREHELFVDDIVLERQGSWADLLTSNRTFVNAELAGVYGLQGDFDEAFETVVLDPSERGGLFTQVGFLAANATAVHPDPIHRGVFLSRRIACNMVAAPPDGVPPLPPIGEMSNREAVERHTEAEGSVCASCHSRLINPFGFAYEHYDAVGAYRTTDNGFPVDATAEVWIDGEAIQVGNAIDLSAVLAEHPTVHGCYVKHWTEFVHGRPVAVQDEGAIDRIAAASAQGASIRDLVLDLVTAPAFLNRAVEESR